MTSTSIHQIQHLFWFSAHLQLLCGFHFQIGHVGKSLIDPGHHRMIVGFEPSAKVKQHWADNNTIVSSLWPLIKWKRTINKTKNVKIRKSEAKMSKPFGYSIFGHNDFPSFFVMNSRALQLEKTQKSTGHYDGKRAKVQTDETCRK